MESDLFYLHTKIEDFLALNCSVAAMSWVAEYLLVQFVRYDFTTYGRSVRGLAKAVHNLVQDKIKKPKGLQEQLKVIYTHSTCTKAKEVYVIV